jgi:hypothetical protein
MNNGAGTASAANRHSTCISPLDKTMELSSGHGILAYQIPPVAASQYKNDRQTVLGVIALNGIPTEG